MIHFTVKRDWGEWKMLCYSPLLHNSYTCIHVLGIHLRNNTFTQHCVSIRSSVRAGNSYADVCRFESYQCWPRWGVDISLVLFSRQCEISQLSKERSGWCCPLQLFTLGLIKWVCWRTYLHIYIDLPRGKVRELYPSAVPDLLLISFVV